MGFFNFIPIQEIQLKAIFNHFRMMTPTKYALKSSIHDLRKEYKIKTTESIMML